MKIQVVGSGCPSCKKLFELTQQAASELGLDAQVEYVPDIQKVIELGLMSSPVITVDGKPVMVGFTPDIKKIKAFITRK